MVVCSCASGADVNRVGPGGSCPMAEACRVGNLKMVQFLVAQGASIETKSPAYKDATPVVIAAMFRHRPVVEFLLSVSCGPGNWARSPRSFSYDNTSPLLAGLNYKNRVDCSGCQS